MQYSLAFVALLAALAAGVYPLPAQQKRDSTTTHWSKTVVYFTGEGSSNEKRASPATHWSDSVVYYPSEGPWNEKRASPENSSPANHWSSVYYPGGGMWDEKRASPESHFGTVYYPGEGPSADKRDVDPEPVHGAEGAHTNSVDPPEE